MDRKTIEELNWALENAGFEIMAFEPDYSRMQLGIQPEGGVTKLLITPKVAATPRE